MKNLKASKLFETFMIWLLSFLMLIKILVIFKLSDIYFKVGMNIASKEGFLTLITRLSNRLEDLKALEIFGLIYRTFLVLLIIVFSIVIINRIINKKTYKLLSGYSINIAIVTMFSVFYVYITKDVFYTIKSITNITHNASIQNIVYLLGRVEALFLNRSILLTLTVLIFVFLLSSIILTLRELTKDDIKINKKRSLSLLFFSIVVLLFLIGKREYNFRESKKFNPAKYMILNYKHNKDEIFYNLSVNMREVNENIIDPVIRDFYRTGINFELKNPKKAVSENEMVNVKFSYNVEGAKELGFIRVGSLEKNIKVSKKPKLATKIEDFKVESLFSYLSKHDERYFKNRKVYGIYEDEIDGVKNYYLIQNIKKKDLTYKEEKTISPDAKDLYKFIYLGPIFVIDEKVVGIEALNSEYSLLFENDEILIKELNKNNVNKVY